MSTLEKLVRPDRALDEVATPGFRAPRASEDDGAEKDDRASRSFRSLDADGRSADRGVIQLKLADAAADAADALTDEPDPDQLDEALADTLAPAAPPTVAMSEAGAASDAATSAPTSQGAEPAATPALGSRTDEVAAGTPVPAAARAPVEAAHGVDLSEVKLRRDSKLATRLGAEAFAMGDEIHLAPGAPGPETSGGQRLLAHELTHVVQQVEGRATGDAGAVNDDASLEAEADRAADAPAATRAPVARADAHSAQSTPVQRKTKVEKSTATYHPAATLRAMKLKDFLAYVKGQLDWAVKLTAAEKAPLQGILTWAMRAPFLGGGCAKIAVDDLIGAADRPAIEAYAKGVNIPEAAATARLGAVDNVPEATALGNAVLRLRTAIDGRCLYHISTPDDMKALVDGAMVEPLVKYVSTCAPALHAHEGTELRSFMEYVKEVGDPTKYKSALPKVRNYHRFERAALDRLVVNYADHSRARPLALVLHTALDWNGAFHRDPNLTALVTHGRNNTLMVEGGGSLADYQSEIGPLSKAYGQDGKVDQVMIAGHGSARSMELAGTVAGDMDGATPVMSQKDDGLDLDNKQAQTEAFFDEITANMADDAVFPWDDPGARRVVFNACLTNANEIDIKPAGVGVPAYEDQIDASVANHASLATTFGQRAKTQGKDVTSIGANGSFGQVELMQAAMRLKLPETEIGPTGTPQLKRDATGAVMWTDMPIFNGLMDIGSHDDPTLTAAKPDYLARGTDPPGVMMALLETWTAPTGTPAAWQTAADQHIAAAGTGWNDTQIKTLLQLVRAQYNADPPAIKRLIGIAVALEFISDLSVQSNWTTKTLTAHPDATTIIAGLMTSPDLWGAARVRILEARAAHGSSADLIAELDSGWTVTEVKDWIDGPFLSAHGALATTLAPSATPTNGQIVLAAADVFNGGGTAESRAFLKHLLAGGSRFPPGLKVGDLLGNKSEDDLLTALGVTTAAPGKEKANVNLDGDTKNERYLEPVNLPGTVTASELNVRRRPDGGARVLGELKAGDSVFVLGKTGDWLGIDYDAGGAHSRVAFVHKDHVSIA